MKPRAVFYSTDDETEHLISDLQSYIQGMGLRCPASDAVRFAIHYTAKTLGLKPMAINAPKQKGVKRAEG